MHRAIYMDHGATTCVRPEVLEAMLPCFQEAFGNPSSVHSFGREARALVDASRLQVASALCASPKEIYFTSGGTEADNTAIIGIAKANASAKGKHIITSAIEHHAVLHTCDVLAAEGYEITVLPVDEYGLVDPAAVQAAIRPDTVLITIMFANNEVGTVQPITEIGEIAHKHGVIFHTDAVQAMGVERIDVQAMHIDALSMSAHKIYGPKGVGALYVRQGVAFSPLLVGGAHERNRRAGTENVPGIVGLAKAVELSYLELDEYRAYVGGLRDHMIQRIQDEIPDVRLNGHPTQRLPGNVNFCFAAAEGESLLLNLDMRGIAASSGSACTSGSLEPSHVLMAMGVPLHIAHSSLRLSLGRCNTMEQVDFAVDLLKEIVERLRAMSPEFKLD